MDITTPFGEHDLPPTPMDGHMGLMSQHLLENMNPPLRIRDKGVDFEVQLPWYCFWFHEQKSACHCSSCVCLPIDGLGLVNFSEVKNNSCCLSQQFCTILKDEWNVKASLLCLPSVDFSLF